MAVGGGSPCLYQNADFFNGIFLVFVLWGGICKKMSSGTPCTSNEKLLLLEFFFGLGVNCVFLNLSAIGWGLRTIGV